MYFGVTPELAAWIIAAAGKVRCASNPHQRAGPGRIPVLKAGSVPVPLVGKSKGPGRPGLGQRGRPGQRARLIPEYLLVMIQDQDLGMLARDALVPCHDLWPVEHLHGGGRQPHRQAAGRGPSRTASGTAVQLLRPGSSAATKEYGQPGSSARSSRRARTRGRTSAPGW